MKKKKSFLSVMIALLILINLVPYKVNAKVLSTNPHIWGYTRNAKHIPPSVSTNVQKLFKKYNAHYVDNTKQKVIYLTFDLGYENEYTNKILNVLKKHKIKATFFVCKAFIDYNPKGLKRMVKEGHVVANHTANHKALSNLSESELKRELKRVEAAYKKVTGKNMVKFVRPPEGRYSVNSLALAKKLGYTTIFWSIALPNDWNLVDQPSNSTTLSLFKNQSHKGAIVLLHGVSPSVADNLDQMLTQLEDKGYQFKLVTDPALQN